MFKLLKSASNQKGAIQFVVLLLLLLGIGVGFYLVNYTTTNLKPRAFGGKLPIEASPSGTINTEYQVKPVILIPADWKNKVSDETLIQYQKRISEALVYVRNWYSTQLDGHTFNVTNYSADVIYTKKPLEYKKQTIDTRTIFDLFLDVDGLNEVKSEDKTIKAVWLIGSENALETGGFYAVLNHASLTGYDDNTPYFEGSTQSKRNHYLGVLTHELGHAFGLVNAGWAKVHPCYGVGGDRYDCLLGVPEPIPTMEDMKKDVMSNSGIDQFPNTGFSNSIHNPEVWKIYQSPFINPKKDPPPFGTVVPSNISATSVPSPTPLPTSRPTISFNISPGNRDPISSTDTITITATVNNGNKFDIWIDWKCFVGSFPANLTGTASFNIAQVVDTGRGDSNNNQCNSSVKAPGEHTIHIAPIRDHTLGQSDGATYIVK